MKNLLARFGEIRRYPSAVAGLCIIGVLVLLSIYAVVAIPYREAIRLWRGADEIWIDNPRFARPKWINYLPGVNESETIVLRSGHEGTKSVSEDGTVTITFKFNYPYDTFPTEMSLFYTSTYVKYGPYVSASWFTPDGRTIPLRAGGVKGNERYLVSSDLQLTSALGMSPEIGLLAPPGAKAKEARPLKGEYRVEITGYLFEEDADLDAKLVLYGRVHGWAGTDHMRRDLTVALLWGTPIAFIFGLLAAVGISASQFTIGSLAAWFGGPVDGSLTFLTRVWMTLPALPIYIMVGMFFSKSIWAILVVVLALGVLGGGVLMYRSMFLQAKEAPYIEAAKAYGAKNMRIVFRYLIPRVIPVLIPGFVSAIPAYVFLEASLAVLGLGDPSLPTWGKVLNESNIAALLQGHYYWVVQPAILLMLTGFAFALVGFALDRIFNPRLRSI